jgi:ATP-dependent RNA helicase RhlB
MRFDELDLPQPLRQGIADAGFTDCTPIQALALPLTLAGRDVAGRAQTGTGKTAAFLITLFTRLLGEERKGPDPSALILAPTRELVVQIANDAELLGRHCGLSVQAVYGGVGYEQQREALRRGVDIVVATPGRLIDYLKQKVFRLDRISTLVIDEADRMFDLGFIADLRFILRRLPPYDQRQNLMFSATLGPRVMELAYEFMNNPERVVVSSERTAENIEEVLFHVGRKEKFPLLLGLLRREQVERAIIFVNTKREGEMLHARMQANDQPSRLISGDVPQEKRLRIMKGFKEGKVPVLIATDVASRGLHVEGVTHVFNYDLPEDVEDYVHRIGRTARAGAEGKAISLADEVGVMSLEAIEAYIGYPIPVEWAEDDLFVNDYRHPPRKNPGGRSGGGKGEGGRAASGGRKRRRRSSR